MVKQNKQWRRENQETLLKDIAQQELKEFWDSRYSVPTDKAIGEYNALVESYDDLKTYKPKGIEIRAESPIMNEKYIIGYWDVVINTNVKRYFGYLCLKYDIPDTIFIEVKPKIDSFGKVLRQIKTYMQYSYRQQYVEYYLYTPDTQYDAAFKGQGINVVHPPNL